MGAFNFGGPSSIGYIRCLRGFKIAASFTPRYERPSTLLPQSTNIIELKFKFFSTNLRYSMPQGYAHLWNTNSTRLISCYFTSLSDVSTQKISTKENYHALQPRGLQVTNLLEEIPPDDLPSHFHSKLQRSYSNPRSILRLYQEYATCDDLPQYSWLVRCFCQLANTFGFNSFWSTKDKQILHGIKLFKCLVHDLIQRVHLVKPNHAPRLIYAMAALEYRSWQILPKVLDLVEENLHKWRLGTLATVSLSLALLGIGDNHGENRFGPIDNLSRDYSGFIAKLVLEVKNRYLTDNTLECGTPFDWSALSFAMVLMNLYDWPSAEESPLPFFLEKACMLLNERNLEHSGWVQYFLYQTLYCSNVENASVKPKIREAIPSFIQKSLHARWLQGILVNGQRQGVEGLQTEVDQILRKLGESDMLINCSCGNSDDEHHCWFVGHFIRSRNLAFEYDYLLPLGPGRPKSSGVLQCKVRLLPLFNTHGVIIHSTLWEHLSEEERLLQVTRLLSKFPKIFFTKDDAPLTYSSEQKTRFLKHQKKTFDAWPPSKIIA